MKSLRGWEFDEMEEKSEETKNELKRISYVCAMMESLFSSLKK